jgi:hypothetical protein
MTELERALVLLGRELDFPAEPDLPPRVRARIERKRRVRRTLVFAVALVVVAFGIAMAVPDARSSILRFFHIGSATVERVHTLPPARERPLAAGLGPALSRHDAEASSPGVTVAPDLVTSPRCPADSPTPKLLQDGPSPWRASATGQQLRGETTPGDSATFRYCRPASPTLRLPLVRNTLWPAGAMEPPLAGERTPTSRPTLRYLLRASPMSN